MMVNDDDKPDPEAFKVHMRTLHAGDDTSMRHDDFVGSYNNTGRVKLDKKKWTPQKPDVGENAFRADEWMGSGKPQRKTWQVKSVTNVDKSESADKPKEFLTPTSPTGRKWKPPPKDQAIPPPWVSSPTSSITKSPRKSWQPSHKSVNASDHTKDTSVQSEMSLSDLHETSDHSRVKDAVQRLSGSMTNLSVSSNNHMENKRGWQSHSALHHDPKSHDKTDIVSHDESSSCAYEVASDDEDAEHHVPKAVERAPAPPVSSPAIGHVAGDDDGRPNPEEFKVHMRALHAGDDTSMRHDDFVGSYSHTGRVKLEKKWTPAKKPEAGDNVFKSDDWMGSGKTQRKSWHVKSPTKVGKPMDDDKPGEIVSPSSPTARKWTPPPKDHGISPPWMPHPAVTKEKISSPHPAEPSQEKTARATEQLRHVEPKSPSKPEPTTQTSSPQPATSPVPAIGVVVDDDDGRPNPEEFKVHMRTVHAGDDTAMRFDDFVGSYSHTGRVKLEKKWKPTTKPEVGDNAFRSDDWMGSGKTQKKSWHVKSTKVGKPMEDDKPGEMVSPSSPTARKWTPPPKDHGISPPWMSHTEGVKEEHSSSEPVKHQPEKSAVSHSHKEEPVSIPVKPEKEETMEVQNDQGLSKSEPVAESSPPPTAVSAAPAAGLVVDDDYGRPNPEEFKVHMRTVHAGDDTAMRHDDFVGSYSHTGRVKLEKKKWTPAQKPEVGENAFRSDDWMGSGAPKKKSWKPKS